MKIERKPKEFRPVSITFETERELNLLRLALESNLRDYPTEALRDFCNNILTGLKHV